MNLLYLHIFTLTILTSCSENKVAKSPEDSVTEKPSEELVLPEKLTGDVQYTLESAEELHAMYPDSFWIPSKEQRISVKKDDLVKLIFDFTNGNENRGERMWVVITGNNNGTLTGTLDNDPYCTDQYKSGSKADFNYKHIIDIYGE